VSLHKIWCLEARLNRLIFTLVFCLFGFSYNVIAATTSLGSQVDNQVLSFKDWKTEKIQVAQKRFSTFAEQNNKDSLMSEIEAQSHTQQLKWNLEIAQDLSITDYTILYLSQTKKPKSAFKQVAEKLSSTDVADLLEAYSKAVEIGRSSTPKMTLPKQATSEN
jgi:hypothetical protein